WALHTGDTPVKVQELVILPRSRNGQLLPTSPSETPPASTGRAVHSLSTSLRYSSHALVNSLSRIFSPNRCLISTTMTSLYPFCWPASRSLPSSVPASVSTPHSFSNSWWYRASHGVVGVGGQISFSFPASISARAAFIPRRRSGLGFLGSALGGSAQAGTVQT